MDYYAGKAVTKIVDLNGKGDYNTIQEAIDALPTTHAGEILVKGGEYVLSKAVLVKDRDDFVIRGVGEATRLKVANKVQELIAQDAASGQKNVTVASGFSFQDGHYIVEDMERGGLRNVTGVNFTDQSKEAMATCLKEKMRSAVCPSCGWAGYVDGEEEPWMTVCPKECLNEEGNRMGLRPMLHIPFDPDLFHELNLERYELSKSGKLLFNHPQGTNDDLFWGLALAVYASEQAQPPPSRPIARVI